MPLALLSAYASVVTLFAVVYIFLGIHYTPSGLSSSVS